MGKETSTKEDRSQIKTTLEEGYEETRRCCQEDLRQDQGLPMQISQEIQEDRQESQEGRQESQEGRQEGRQEGQEGQESQESQEGRQEGQESRQEGRQEGQESRQKASKES